MVGHHAKAGLFVNRRFLPAEFGAWVCRVGVEVRAQTEVTRLDTVHIHHPYFDRKSNKPTICSVLEVCGKLAERSRQEELWALSELWEN